MTDAVFHLEWDEILRVQLYCERVRARLGLIDWRVGIEVEPADDDAHANISAVNGKRFASVRLCTTWSDLTIETKRRVLLHEMLHLIHQRQQWAVFDAARMHRAVCDSYWRESEYMIDGLTTALADVTGFMPAWPSAKEARASGHTNQEHG